MAKLAVIALLGMLCLTAAVDVEPQTKKQHHKEKEEPHVPANVHAKHKQFELTEHDPSTHPCVAQYEIFGSTVAQSATLKDGEATVGHVYWSGVVAKHELCADCKDYKPTDFHAVKVNTKAVFEFTKEHTGQITCALVSESMLSDARTKCAVTGGSGAFLGAWGTITWQDGTPAKYSFNLYLPKVIKDKDYHESDKQYKYAGDKY